ncbi:MAG: glutamine synthetase family protein [Gammaproteobacteria bacterium]|jgi:glutamine synthetase|nr:glutamine synthetase family protein [Gammaproteobacteria bacterium]
MKDNSKLLSGLQELEQFLEKYPDTRFIDAILVDLCGIVRGKRFGRDEFDNIFTSGVLLPHSTYFLDVTGHCNNPLGMGVTDGDPDGTAVPVPGTLVSCPWTEAPTAQVLMNMRNEDGTPSAVDPRNVAARVIDKFSELGLTPVIAFELEFYLLDKERDARGFPQASVSAITGERENTTQVFGIAELEGHAKFFAAVEDAARAQNVPTSVATTEFAPAQYEINLHHTDLPLIAADHCALLRHIIKSVATRHSLNATFMSKPFADLSGNGMHVHISLVAKDGKNVFDDGSASGSDALRYAIGGLMTTMADSFAIFAPNVNAYRRFRPHTYVPVTKSWGLNNRSVACRIPSGSANARRVEHRVAGADANPYLTLAVLLAGVHHGLVNKIDPGPSSDGNACTVADPNLPLDLDKALNRLATSTTLASYIDPHYIELYCATKRGEMEKFRRHLPPLEYDWYL